jgi:D-arabinose 1-dehydrogenase-like Zn-dependent alcohol dehydrogenase
VLPSVGAGLRVEELDLPAPRDGDLLVQVELGGVCGTDLHLTQGHLAVPTPLVLGHEGVGRVAAVGAGVEVDALGQPLHVGDRVTWASSIPCGRCHYCEHEREPTLCTDRKVYGITRGAEQWPHLSGSWADHI